MKKCILFAALLVATFVTQAQKCVVLDFQMGNNVTQEEAEAVSYEFRSTFNPSCYTVFEHGRVAKQVKDLGYSPASMTKDQIRRVGRYMDATIVVYGTLSKYMEEYSLDVFVLDVSTGTTVVNQSSVFQKSEYRTRTREVPESIIAKLCNTSPSPRPDGRENTQTVPQGYTDLGLPSGTIWKNINATGFYTYDDAVSLFGNRLPTKEQWVELMVDCQWSWTGSGYKVTGPNGNSINLPAAGWRSCDSGEVYSEGNTGDYWSSTSDDTKTDCAWSLHSVLNGVEMESYKRCFGNIVRLVLNP